MPVDRNVAEQGDDNAGQDGFDLEAERIENEPDEDEHAEVDDGSEDGETDDAPDDNRLELLGDEEDEDDDQDDSDDLAGGKQDGRSQKGQQDADGSERFITVKVDGKEIRVTEREAAEGYSRTADYTRKTQAVAEQRKAVEALHARLTERLKEYEGLLDEALRTVKPEDLERLRAEDPQQYLLVKDQLKAVEEERQRVKQEEQRLAAEQRAKEDEEFAAFVAGEREKLYAALPHWKDPKLAAREVRAIHQGLLDAGVTPEELADPRSVVLNDHRFVLLVRDAMLWRRQRSEGKHKARPVPAGKTLRPGARPAENTGIRQAKERLARSGSERDAAALFARIPGLLDEKPKKRRR